MSHAERSQHRGGGFAPPPGIPRFNLDRFRDVIAPQDRGHPNSAMP